MKPSAPSEIDDGNAFRNASAAPAHDAAELPSPRLGGTPFRTRTWTGWEIPVAARRASITIPAVFSENVVGRLEAPTPSTANESLSAGRIATSSRTVNREREDVEARADVCDRRRC